MAKEVSPEELRALAAEVEALAGPCREMDARIAEAAYGWKPCPIPPDYDGNNACDVLTPDGTPFRTDAGFPWVYPTRGKVHRGYHCREYTRDAKDSAIPRDYVRKNTAAQLRARAASMEQR